MPTNTAHGLPIPAETDPLGATDERIAELAEYLDSHLFTPRFFDKAQTYAALDLRPAPPELLPADGRVIIMDPDESGIDARMVTIGPVVQLTLFARRWTGLGDNEHGDITNQPFSHVIGNPAFRPVSAVGGCSLTVGPMASYGLNTVGEIYLAALGSAAPAGTQLSASFTYIRRG